MRVLKKAKRLNVYLLVVLCISFWSCNDNDDTGGNPYIPPASQATNYRVQYNAGSCSIPEKNLFISSLLHDTYLWEAQVPNLDFISYSSTKLLLNDLRYSPLDKWSYITSKSESDALTQEGKFIGYGFSYKKNIAGIRTVYQVHKDSPADIAGIKRGDQFISLNGLTYDEIDTRGLWGSIWGSNEIGTSLDITVIDTNDIVTQSTIIKDWVTIDIIPQYKIIDSNGIKIGYLIFNSFKSYISQDLDDVFQYFDDENIDELIVDLRYDGGGSILISRKISSLIAGTDAADETFINYSYNERYPHWNHSRSFEEPANNLNLSRAIFITTSRTCSASELVINGLSPIMDVIIIGDTTCGKPVGWHGGYDFCNLHISYPEFKMENSNNEGNYFSGLQATCPATDDLEKPRGDIEEASLQEAIDFIHNNHCSASAVKTNKQIISSNNSDDWGNNNFGRHIGIN